MGEKAATGTAQSRAREAEKRAAAVRKGVLIMVSVLVLGCVLSSGNLDGGVLCAVMEGGRGDARGDTRLGPVRR